jgi:hypothetical protein
MGSSIQHLLQKTSLLSEKKKHPPQNLPLDATVPMISPYQLGGIYDYIHKHDIEMALSEI